VIRQLKEVLREVADYSASALKLAEQEWGELTYRRVKKAYLGSKRLHKAIPRPVVPQADKP
jgi:hypothetical protein